MRYIILIILLLIISFLQSSCISKKDSGKVRQVLMYMDTTYVKGIGLNKKYSLNEVCRMWKADTFGCLHLRESIITKDSNFTAFVYTLHRNDLVHYFGKPTYIQNGKNILYPQPGYGYIISGDSWCNYKELRNFKKMKYVCENYSYTGITFCFDKNGKVVFFYFSIYG